MKAQTEAELAAKAKAWLEGRGFEVFQEVEAGGHRIDLVGRARGVVVAVECKLCFGLDVLTQARRWVGDASESWVAVPFGRTWRLKAGVALEYCGLIGLGVLGVSGPSGAPRSQAPFHVSLEAIRTDPKGLAERWRKRLHPEQKTAAPAGTNGGGYSTAFGRFCKVLAEYIEAHPGVALGDVERALEHPFSGRRSFMALMPSKFAVGPKRDARLARVRLEGNGVKATLWPAGDAF